MRLRQSWGAWKLERREMIEAGKLSNGHALVNQFSQGYDTDVGESGAQLRVRGLLLDMHPGRRNMGLEGVAAGAATRRIIRWVLL